MQKLMAIGIFKENLSLQSTVVVRDGLVDRRVEETDFGKDDKPTQQSRVEQRNKVG